ncbi:MAG: T9SS type A sorting domain-containing protein [Bacteroidota bacterium]|nr:T9SS type A sorting domain-containing protein [Bacteroidota bacterium]
MDCCIKDITGKDILTIRAIFFYFILIILPFHNTIAQTSGQPVKSTTSAFGCGPLEGGYASKLSVYQGEKLSFYISTKADTFTLKIYRYGKEKNLVAEIKNLPGGIQEVMQSDLAYVNGCNWEVTLKDFTVPNTWKAGAYIAEFPVKSDTINPILFFVKEKDPSKRSKVILACATNTYQAYNMFGGKSSYSAYSSGGEGGAHGFNYSVKLSFNRPVNRNNHEGTNHASFYSYESKLIRWLEDTGYGSQVDVVGDSDLDSDPEYLNSHKVLFIGGHSEYWSQGMRLNVENFINTGGHLISLSGNTCWWQIRYEDNYRTLVCYKNLKDPNPNPQLTTSEWFSIRRENTLLGTSYQNGGQANYGNCLNSDFGYGGYMVYNTQHWAFNNTGLKDGDTLGWNRDSSIVGFEADAALFYFQKGLPVVTGVDQTPKDFQILGISPVNKQSQNIPKEWATMGIFRYGGAGSGFVFNAAAIRWIWGLSSGRSKVSTITKNILQHFLQDKIPPEFTYWSPYSVKSEIRFSHNVQFNSRIEELQYGNNLTLRVKAKDYDSGKIFYKWAVNDTVLSDAAENSFIFQSVKHTYGKNKVTAFAYNLKDTSSISWIINTMPGTLAIDSIPDTVIKIGIPYKYRISYYSKFNDQISFIINHLPQWAKFNTITHSIEGIPDSSADSISISVKDMHGDEYTQSFILRKADTSTSTYTNEGNIVGYNLSQNYPNPFNITTSINFSISQAGHVSLSVYDILGNKVAVLVDNDLQAGNYNIKFDGKALAGGVYIYRIESGKFYDSKKLVLLK